jgi:hypothetical protein
MNLLKGVDIVPLNTVTHTQRNVILTKDMDSKIIQLASENERSISAQIVYMLKQQLKEDSK